MNYRINLLPSELQPSPPVEGKRLAVIAGLTVLAALMLIGGTGCLLNSYNQRMELAVIRSQLASLAPVVQKVQANQAEEQKFKAGAAALEGLLARHRMWKPVLDDIAQILPVDMWLTSIDAAYDKNADQSSRPTSGGITSGNGAQTPGGPAPTAAGPENNGAGTAAAGGTVAGAENGGVGTAVGAPVAGPGSVGAEVPAGNTSGSSGETGAALPAGVQQKKRASGQVTQYNQSLPGQLPREETPAQQQDEAKDEVPLPPNVMTVKGISRSFPSIGVFVRKLSVLPYFRRVSLKEVASQKDGTLSFTIFCYLQPQ